MSPEDLWVSARQHERRIGALELAIAEMRQDIGTIERHLGLDMVSDHVADEKGLVPDEGTTQ